MVNLPAIFAKPSTEFDGWRSISIALFMALVGYTVMVSVPVLSTALVVKVGFTEEQVENCHVPRTLPVICLVAVCFTYINIGGYYTYIELAEHADGIAEGWVGPLLTWSSIFAIVGCVIAFFSTRFGLQHHVYGQW